MGFADDIKKFAEATKKTEERIALELAVDLTRLAVRYTSVDTGNARGGWTGSIDTPIINLTMSSDKTGTRTINKATTAAKKAVGKVYYLTNSVPYIFYLEYGTKNQAPKAMARRASAEVMQKMKSYIAIAQHSNHFTGK